MKDQMLFIRQGFSQNLKKMGLESIFRFTGNWLLVIIILLVSETRNAKAVPSFARQTGLSCTACHNTFPELNSFGRQFKLNSYTLAGIKTIDATDANGVNKLKLLTISSLSAMAQTSFNYLNKEQPGVQNGNIAFPQQFSLFYAGEITPHIGAFVQITYDGQEGSIGMDNADIRYSNQATLGSKELTYGFTINNNPTVQDIWNSTSAWGFPYASSGTAPSPMAGTLIEGGLAQQVAGAGAYGLFNNLVYGEFSLYRSTQALDGGLMIKGAAPYWRVALQHQWTKQYLEVGTFGMSTNLYPFGVSGLTNQYTDLGFDMQYEYALSKSNLTIHSSWVNEKQKLNYSSSTGDASNANNNLNSFKIDGTLYFQKGYAATLGYFFVNGSMDPGLYAPAEVDGSRTGSPDSNGLIAQVSYFPWYNTRISLQYVMYNKFNGTNTNYDGNNRNATDNNNLYVLLWFNF